MGNSSTVPIIDPTGKAWDIPADKVPDALKAGGKLGMSVTAPDNSNWLIPADRVHEAIAQGGKLTGAPPAKPNIPVQSSIADTAMGTASKVADAVQTAAKPVIGASAPNIAIQLAKHLRGEPNSLKEIPGDAVATFLMAGGAGEAEGAATAEGTATAAEKNTPKEVSTPAAAATAAPKTAAIAEAPTAKPSTVSPADLERQLNDALGGKPLEPGVPLRDQGKAGASLPAGFTPVKSSVLKGYKYDPATQEFDGVTTNGQVYRHAQVTPEQFQAFADADSKGAAWNDLRNSPGVTPLGKVVNGKLQPRVKPQASSEITLPAGQTESDLSPLLQESLKRARALRAARNQPNP